jgi:L-ascorbate metabolism protein UlaG (beta-lactamase superfamily)
MEQATLLSAGNQRSCTNCDYQPQPVAFLVNLSYDHLDLHTLRELNDNVVYFVPLGNKKWILDNVGSDLKVYECDWW